MQSSLHALPNADVAEEEEEDACAPVEEQREIVDSEDDVSDDNECEDDLHIDAFAQADLAADERMCEDS